MDKWNHCTLQTLVEYIQTEPRMVRIGEKLVDLQNGSPVKQIMEYLQNAVSDAYCLFVPFKQL